MSRRKALLVGVVVGLVLLAVGVFLVLDGRTPSPPPPEPNARCIDCLRYSYIPPNVPSAASVVCPHCGNVHTVYVFRAAMWPRSP